MNITENAKNIIDNCRFCWMCRHVCPIGNATGLERNTARARAFGASMVVRGATELAEKLKSHGMIDITPAVLSKKLLCGYAQFCSLGYACEFFRTHEGKKIKITRVKENEENAS